MKGFRLGLGMLFRKQDTENEDLQIAWEFMAREIKGSIFTLIALFELVSLVSYIPLDSFNIFEGRLDHINNLGGIVGALVSEWFLGTVGVNGYSIVLVTMGLAFISFRGGSIKSAFFKILGMTLATVLAAIACQLLLSDKFPEASLLQGGYVGKNLGNYLRHYFNTTGAMLIVGGGFMVTLILTTGLSLSQSIGHLFAGDGDEDPAPVIPIAKPRPISVQVAEPESKKKRRSRKKKPNENDPDLTASANEEGGEEKAAAKPDEEMDENQRAEAAAGFKFQELIPFTGKYEEPSLRLLKSAPGGVKKLSRGEMKDISRKLTEHLLSFQITGQVVNVSQGPVLTTFEFKPSAGIKLSKIANLQDDLGVVLGTRELRIIAPIPGKTVVGIEVPRPQIETIALKDVLSEDEFYDKKLRLPFALGKTTDGKATFGDMASLPHLLVAGSTGSGKSVFVNALIMSFLFRLSPQELRLILIDPKMLELNAFEGLPHLLTNVITNNQVAFNALNWAVIEMDRRYKMMAETGSKNIDSYNSKARGANKLPFIVIVVDELADLMMSGGEDVEIAITRLAQKARAAGIHLVLATQRPSTEIITGLIKANIPSRLSFKVPSSIDSRTILDTSGAEELIGRGDSLMVQPAIPLRRLHGCFVTEEELARVVKYITGGKSYKDYYIDFGGAPPSED